MSNDPLANAAAMALIALGFVIYRALKGDETVKVEETRVIEVEKPQTKWGKFVEYAVKAQIALGILVILYSCGQ